MQFNSHGFTPDSSLPGSMSPVVSFSVCLCTPPFAFECLYNYERLFVRFPAARAIKQNQKLMALYFKSRLFQDLGVPMQYQSSR